MSNDHDRYLAAAHAVQTAVATTIGLDTQFAPTGVVPDTSCASPKHLRTGLDLRAVDHGALARLLIAKGVFTEEEYVAALAEGAEQEARTWSERLSKRLGKPVTLA
jgi:hypothetical protein